VKTIFRSGVVLGDETLTKTTTANPMADVGTLDVDLFKTKYLTFAAAANTLSVQILGSQDGGLTFPTTVEAAFDVTVASQVLKTVTAFYTHLKVQVAPKVGGAHGTLTAIFRGASY
jgi:hypothetical protein